MAAIRYIYLDVGGVAMLDYSGTNNWDRMMEDMGVTTPEKKAAFMAVWNRHRDHIDTDYDIEDMVPQLHDEVGIHIDPGFSLNAQMVKFYRPNPYILQPIRRAYERGIGVGLLTNMYVGLLERIRTAGLLPPVRFEQVVDSSVVKLAKPDPAIFALVGIPVDAILFVDNAPENVAAARELGWQTMRYDPIDPQASSGELLRLIG